MAMATLKQRMHKKNASGGYDIIHLETEWNCITGKPSTFPPSAHTHDWGGITGKPGTFAPSTHTHAPSQCGALPSTGGTLTGNLRIHDGDNSSVHKLNLGDGEYVYISEPTDDQLEVKGGVITFVADELRFNGCSDESSDPLPIDAGGTGATTPSGALRMLGAASAADLNSLKTSVSNGKSAVASAITDKGISTSATASFDTLAANIRKISSGGYCQEAIIPVGPNIPDVTFKALGFIPETCMVVIQFHTIINASGLYINSIGGFDIIYYTCNTYTKEYGWGYFHREYVAGSNQPEQGYRYALPPYITSMESIRDNSFIITKSDLGYWPYDNEGGGKIIVFAK